MRNARIVILSRADGEGSRREILRYAQDDGRQYPMGRRRADGYVMISVIAERYNIHPQTLRLYEREGLIKPARTAGNTRLYGQDEIRTLELILALTRDLGVNLAGVEVILNLQNAIEDAREAIGRAEDHFEQMMRIIRQAVLDKRHGIERENALVRMGNRSLTKTSK